MFTTFSQKKKMCSFYCFIFLMDETYGYALWPLNDKFVFY